MKKLIASILVAACVIGCTATKVANNLFRSEQAAVNLAYTSYVGWTNYMAVKPVSIETSNTVKQARLKVAASLLECENLRRAYSTNTTVLPQWRAAIEALNAESANMAALIAKLQD